MRSTCLYCDTPLVPYAHWGLCPKCEPDFIKQVTPPTIAEMVRAKVGDLLQDKGRPTRNGKKA